MEHGTTIEVRPGQAVFQKLFDVVTSTAERLDGIWEHVGCSPDERREHLEGLVAEFRKLCAAKVKEEESVRDQFLVNIKQLKEEIVDVSKRMGEEVEYPLATGAEGNLTDRLGDLEVRAEELRQRKESQLNRVKELREKVVTTLRRMGGEVTPDLEEETDISTKRIESLEERSRAVEGECEARVKAIAGLVSDVQGLMKELKLDTLSALDQQVMGSLPRPGSTCLTSLDASASSVGIHADVLQRLTERAAELVTEKRRRAERLKALGDQIAELWDRLKVPESVREAFSSSVAGLGQDTLEAGERELARLTVLKKEMLGTLIEEARTQIGSLWEEMEVGAGEREDFAPLSVSREGYCDDLLAVHEQEITRLNVRLELVKPILKMIAKRQEIVRERKEMEELQKDSSRLTDRAGGKRVTEELMRLEKMQKRVKKDLPLLTDKLKKRLQEWEKTESEGNGQPFLFRGVPYLKRIDEEEEEWNSYKETLRLEKEARKREELEKYKQNHSNPIHTPGNLLPRALAVGSSAKAGVGPSGGPASSSGGTGPAPGSSVKKGLASAKKGHTATSTTNTSHKPSACAASSFETPVKPAAGTAHKLKQSSRATPGTTAASNGAASRSAAAVAAQSGAVSGADSVSGSDVENQENEGVDINRLGGSDGSPSDKSSVANSESGTEPLPQPEEIET